MRSEILSGVTHTFGPIKTGVGRNLRDKYPDTTDFNIAMVAESLKAGGNDEATPAWVDENINYFVDFNTALKIAFEVNGFKVETPKVGEEQPPIEAAESTSDTTTGA